ncbi:MAG: hypothetical protein ABIR47_16905 [Candidatus Kapaibacterium sp.]
MAAILLPTMDMKLFRRPVKARLAAFMAVACSCVALAPSVRAQQDPFAVEPEHRRKSTIPIPYGLIVGGRIPLTYSTPDLGSGSVDKITAIDVDAYYDTWSAGYHRKDYGNMFDLMFRSATRDVYGGWYLEVGSSTFNILPREEFGNDSGAVGVSRFVFGVGMKGNSGYGTGVKFLYSYDFSAGSTNSDNGSLLYAYGQMAAGIRIPIATTALALGINAYAGFIPPTRVTSGNGSDPSGIVGLGFFATYALNFERE